MCSNCKPPKSEIAASLRFMPLGFGALKVSVHFHSAFTFIALPRRSLPCTLTSLFSLAVADEAGFEALGAVGGASSNNSASDDLAEFADVFQSSLDPSPLKAGRDEAAEAARRPQSAVPLSSALTFQTAQSLHPPQFHRPASHAGRQSEPHHVVRNRALKDRHSDFLGGSSSAAAASSDRHHGHHPHHHHHTPSSQRPMNPGINVWVSTNGQLSGSSAMDKAPAGGPVAELGDGPPPVPLRRQSGAAEKRAERHQVQPQEPLSAEKENRASQDSGNPLIEITEALKSPTSAADPTDSLGDLEQAEPLTLSEQQNTRIDESRLSAALSMFDPFSAEGDGDGDVPLSTNANNNRSVETLKDTFGVSSGAGDNLANISSRSVDSAIGLLCEDDSALKDAKVNGGAAVGMGGSAEEKERGVLRKNGAVPPTGGSGFLQRDSPDNISIQSDEKVLTVPYGWVKRH